MLAFRKKEIKKVIVLAYGVILIKMETTGINRK
jgi:hypothetical protein